jgi:exosortase A
VSAGHLQHGWRIAGFSVMVLLLVTLGMYHETVSYLTSQWNQLEIGEYAHGYLVLAISGYLILRNRQVLSAQTPCPQYWALVAVMAASLLWLLAVLVDVLMLQTVALLLLVLAVAWTVLGNRVTWMLLLPILFIGYAIPIWFPLAPLLQDLSADVVFRLIRMLGIPAFLQGNDIVLPTGMLSVTEACSGLRYLLPALALGTLYGYLNYASYSARLLVVLIAAGAAVFINIVRVFIVVYLGYATDMQHPFVSDHLVLGWYLFGGMVVILLALDLLLHRHRQPADPVNATVSHDPLSTSCEIGWLQYVAVVVTGSILASAGPAVAYWVDHRPPVDNARVELELPAGAGGWTGPVASDNDWMPEYRGAITRKQAYQKDGERVDLYIGYYPVQRQGEELIGYLNRISNEHVWHTRNPKGSLQQAGNMAVLEQLLEKGGSAQRLVWYWYSVAGWQTTNKYQAKTLQVLGLVTGKPDASVVAVAIATGDDADHARKVLGEFVSTMKRPLARLNDHNQ